MSTTVRETLEGMISTVTNQAANTSDKILPLAVTPRVRHNRIPPLQRPLQNQLPARKSLFGASTVDESEMNDGVTLVGEPDDTCPSDDARAHFDPNNDLPESETLRD